MLLNLTLDISMCYTINLVECIATSVGAIATACVCIMTYKQMCNNKRMDKSAKFTAKYLGESKIEITNVGHSIARNVSVELKNAEFQQTIDDLDYDSDKHETKKTMDLGSIQAFNGSTIIELDENGRSKTVEYTIKWDDDNEENRKETKTINIF